MSEKSPSQMDGGDACSFCLSPTNKILVDLACGHLLCGICCENLVDKIDLTIICPLDLVITEDLNVQKWNNENFDDRNLVVKPKIENIGDKIANCAECSKNLNENGESWFCGDCGLTLCSSCAMKNHRFHACNPLNFHLIEQFNKILCSQKEKFRRLFDRDLEIFARDFVRAFKFRLEPLKNVVENFAPPASGNLYFVDQTHDANLALKKSIFSEIGISNCEELEKMWNFEILAGDSSSSLIETLIDFCLSSNNNLLVEKIENLKLNDADTPTESSAASPSTEDSLQAVLQTAAAPKFKVASYSAAAKLPAAKSEKTVPGAASPPIFDASLYLNFQWLNYFRQKVCGVAELYAVAGCGVLYVDSRFLILYNQNLASQISRGWANPSNEFSPHTNTVLHHLPTRSLLVVHKGPRDDFLNDEYCQLSVDDLSIKFSFKNDRNFQRHLFPQLTKCSYFSLQLLTDNRILLLVNYKNKSAKIFVSDLVQDFRRLFENFVCVWQKSNFPETFQQVSNGRGEDIYAVGSRYLYHFHIKPKSKYLAIIRRLSLMDNCPIVSYRGFLYRFDSTIKIGDLWSIESSKIEQICWSKKDERIYILCKTGVSKLDEMLVVGEIKMMA